MNASSKVSLLGRTWLVVVFVLTGMLGLCLPSRADKGAPSAVVAKEAKKEKPSTVPFELLASNHMVVKAKINGKGPYRLVFDVGAPITLLGNKAAEGSGVVKADAPKSFLFSMRGEGQIDDLEVGDLKTKDLPVIVLDHPVLKALAGFLGRPLDGIIGFTFFAHYKTTIDYQALTMTFEPVDFKVGNLVKDLPDRLSGPKRAKDIVLAPSGVWGLAVDAPAGEHPVGVRIRSVAAGSPAEAAGLKVGDVLTTLDGRWTTSVADVFAAAADADVNVPAEAIILRDGKEMTLKVTPKAGL